MPAAARVFAWAGALLFFGSLAYFLYAYTVTYGVAAPLGDPTRAITSNVALFTFFAAHHSLFARHRVRRWVTAMLPTGLERSLYVWIASLIFIAVCAWWQPVPGIAWSADGAALWGLRALQVAGIGLSLGSAAILDIWELAGLTVRRPEGLRLPGDEKRSVAGSPQASGLEFKTRGPYGWVRHPIYSGWLLLVFAASPMTMTRLLFAVVSGVYLLIAIPFEERSMQAISHGAYERYRAQVRWRLIPRVY